MARPVEDFERYVRCVLTRGLAVVGLVGIALVHLVELPSTWRQTAGLGGMFLLLVVAASAIAVALTYSDRAVIWQAGALVSASAIGGFVLTRSVAVPFDRGDVGNWLEPLGLVALFVEATVLALSAYALLATRSEL